MNSENGYAVFRDGHRVSENVYEDKTDWRLEEELEHSKRIIAYNKTLGVEIGQVEIREIRMK